VIYVKNVLIPGVENLRKLHKLEGERAGLLMDGAYAHEAAEALNLLEQANIKGIGCFRPSHLTQSLDLVRFCLSGRRHQLPTTSRKGIDE